MNVAIPLHSLKHFSPTISIVAVGSAKEMIRQPAWMTALIYSASSNTIFFNIFSSFSGSVCIARYSFIGSIKAANIENGASASRIRGFSFNFFVTSMIVLIRLSCIRVNCSGFISSNLEKG